MILYSAKSIIDAEGLSAYRITKFADGEVESSYLTNGVTCDCPAGPRPTCRHRQMLPQMISSGIVNTHWFLDWDLGRVICDFEGTPKARIDAMLPPPADRQTFTIPDGYTAVRDAEGRATGEITPTPGEALQSDLPLIDPTLCEDEGCPNHGTPHVCVTPATPSPTQSSWRRI